MSAPADPSRPPPEANSGAGAHSSRPPREDDAPLRLPLQVGLTGGIASGKSAVARVWEEAGVPVVSADTLAREVVAPGTEGLDAVVAAFGEGILTPDGTLDRPALRARILDDPGARRTLEALTHPRIAALRRAWVEARRQEGHPLVVSEIPLLFEAGLEHAVDRIVVVDAPLETRIRRVVEHRGLPAHEARALAEAQGDPEEKRARAHYLIENEGTLAELEARAREVLDALRTEALRAEDGRTVSRPSPFPRSDPLQRDPPAGDQSRNEPRRP